MKLIYQILLLLFVPIALQVCVVAMLIGAHRDLEHELEREAQSKELIRQSQYLSGLIFEATTEFIDYGIDGNSEHFEKYKALEVQVAPASKKLNVLAQGKACEVDTKKLMKLVDEMLAMLERQERQMEGDSEASFLTSLRSFKHIQFRINGIAKQLKDIVRKEMPESEKAHLEVLNARKAFPNIVWLGFASSSCLAVALALSVGLRAARRADLIVENLRRFANDEPLMAPISGNDEFAYMDRAFREMALSISALVARERSLIEEMPIGLLGLNGNAEVVECNSRVSNILEIHVDEIIGRKLYDLFEELPPDAIEEVSETGTRMYECACVNRSGESRKLELWISELVGVKGRELIVNIVDVSERKAAELLKRRFIAMASHELRSPLTSISAMLELMQLGKLGSLSSDGLKGVKRARTNVSRLVRLINNLLSFEKMDKGHMRLNPGYTSTSRILDAAVSSLQDLADERFVNLKVLKSPVELIADEAKLIEVLVNLVSNAIKFSPSGGAVLIGVIDHEDEVEFYVIDEGPGIDPLEAGRIFEPFYQAEEGERLSGSGLGLSISQAIVSAHKGVIGCTNNSTGGARFYFRISHEPRDGF